jgi:hypothetical protein
VPSFAYLKGKYLLRTGDRRRMPERFGVSIDNAHCGRTMPLLRAKIRRLNAKRHGAWTKAIPQLSNISLDILQTA